jgi:HK97 family phage major capsid protein
VEVKEQIEDLGKQLNVEIKKALSLSEQTSAESKKQFEQISKDITEKFGKYDELVKKQQEHLDALETKYKKGELERPEAHKSFDQHLEEAFKTKQSDLQQLKSRQVNSVNFDIKAAGTMLIGTNYTGSVGLTTWDSEWTRPARRSPYIRQLVTNRRINSLYVAYAEMKNRDGGAGMVAEGAAKPQTDFDIVEATKKVEKVAHWIKTSKEALDDIVGLRSEINTELVEGINLKLDEQILAGDGVTPNLTGILTYLTSALSVVGTPFALGVDTPNNYDVLMVAAATVQANFFNPNYAIVHPLDLASMQMVKDANGQYVLPPFSTAEGTVIAGLRVVANQGMTLGNFLVGDFSKDVLAIREEINIQVGYVNDDFTKNLVTILAEMRAVNYIKSNNLGAFVRGTFATVKTAITLP